MRARRWKVGGEEEGYYHCMSRICGGEGLLGEVEKEVFRRMMWQVAGFCGVGVLTYAVMSNHFHVLVRVPAKGAAEPSDRELVRRYELLFPAPKARLSSHEQPTPEVLESLLAAGGPEAERWRERLRGRMHDVSFFMRLLKQRFSVWYNRSHGRYGTLWAERFKSVLVEPGRRALTTVAAYIDLNAVRAGLVEDPATYRWCGYGEAMGGSAAAREGLAGLFGGSGTRWRSVAADYRALLFGIGSGGRVDQGKLSREAALEVVRSGGRVPVALALRCRVRYFTDGAALGSANFVQQWLGAARAQGAHDRKRKRKRVPQAMEGAEWGPLAVARGLRRAVFE